MIITFGTQVIGGQDANGGAIIVAPTVQASNIVFSNIYSTNSFTVSWTNGNGTNRVVLIKAATAVDSNPVDNTTYTANAAFGSGSQIGSGNYVVYNGSGTTVNVTGLTAGVLYFVRVYEYNGSSGGEKYYTVTATNNPSSQLTIDTDVDAFFTRMVGLGDAVPTSPIDYKTLYNNFIVWTKNTTGYDGTTTLYNGFDALYIRATYSKTASLQNIKSSSFTTTITNTYAGDFVAKRGLVGNGTNFATNFNINPFNGGTYKYKTNDASIGVIVLTDTAINQQDVTGATGLGGGVFLMPKVTSGPYSIQSLTSINVTTVGGGFSPASPVSIGLFAAVKQATLVNKISVNGYDDVAGPYTAAADFSTSINFRGHCRDVGGASNFSTNTHALNWIGSGNIDPNKMLGGFFSKWGGPLGDTKSSLGKRIAFVGDSMSGPGGTLSVDCKLTSTTLLQLGDGWIGAPMGIASRTLSTINSTLSTKQLPFRMSLLTKDIVILWAGTNDLAGLGSTATTVYNLVVSTGNSLKSAGFQVIVIGVIDRQGGITGTTQGGFNTQRASLRTLHLADFTTSTAVPNFFTGGSYADGYVDVQADTAYQNALDTTYYNADKIHLNSTGYTRLGQTYIAPGVLLL